MGSGELRSKAFCLIHSLSPAEQAQHGFTETETVKDTRRPSVSTSGLCEYEHDVLSLSNFD